MTDSNRHVFVRLADPSHKLPIPNSKRLFPAEGELVDTYDPYWLQLIGDGSVVVGEPAEAQPSAPPVLLD